MTPQEEYLAYLQRYARATGRTMEDISHDLICQEVGKEYGLTDEELIEINSKIQGGKLA